jgi:hypothetical protein
LGTRVDNANYLPLSPGRWDPLECDGSSVPSVTTDATVEVVDHGGPHTVVRLKVSEVESDPIAPGWMGWQTAEGDQVSFVVHRLLSRNGKRIILEALERSDLPLPPVGQQVSYTSMWSPDQLSIVTDVSRTWTLVHIDRSTADKYLASPGTAERPHTDAVSQSITAIFVACVGSESRPSTSRIRALVSGFVSPALRSTLSETFWS